MPHVVEKCEHFRKNNCNNIIFVVTMPKLRDYDFNDMVGNINSIDKHTITEESALFLL